MPEHCGIVNTTRGLFLEMLEITAKIGAESGGDVYENSAR